jgi:hypothetical protein
MPPTVPEDTFIVDCPYCGETQEVYVEPDVRGTFVQDCEVCCRPWQVSVSKTGRARSLHLGRADGSD